MAQSGPTTNRRAFWFRAAGTLLALVLLVLLLWQQGWDEIAAALSRLTWWQIGLAVLLTMISRLAVSMRWYVLLRSSQAPVSAWQAVRLTFAGLFASNFLPTTIGGDVVRLAGAVRLGCGNGVALASLVVDRLVGMAGMALVAPLSLPAILNGGLRDILQGTPAALGMAVSDGWMGKLRDRLQAEWRKLVDALLIWWKQPRSLLFSLLFTFIHMLCHYTSIWVFLQGMGEKMPFWLIAGAWSLTYFITLIPVSINGLGLQELSTTLLFAGLGGISTAGALTLGVLIRVVQMFASLFGAAFIPELMAGTGRKTKGGQQPD